MKPTMSETVKGLVAEAKSAFVKDSGSDLGVGLFECHKDPKTFACLCCCPCLGYVQVGLNSYKLRGGKNEYNHMCQACCFGQCYEVCLRQEIR